MTDDHLDKETSLSVELTENGINAGAKSRTIAAIDRLCGSVFDLGAAHVEAATSKRRAKTAGEVLIIGEAATQAAAQLGVDPQYAARAIGRHYSKVLHQQENADSVVTKALEDLRESPPSEEQTANAEPMDDDFLNRFEFYANGASTEQLRERWGRVLAAEVRAPGTFSAKVLRVIDEMDSAVAQKFENLCQHRIGPVVLRVFAGQLSYDEKNKLVAAGLLIDPGEATQYRQYQIVKDNSGTEIYYTGDKSAGQVAFPVYKPSGEPSVLGTISDVLIHDGGVFGLPAYLLTDAGHAIASILTDNQANTLRAYALRLKQDANLPWVRIYRPTKAATNIPEIL